MDSSFRGHGNGAGVTVLIIGATGQVGPPLADLLMRSGARVRAISRRPAAAALPAGTEVIAGDAQRPDTLVAALTGVDVLVVSPRAVDGAAAAVFAEARRQRVARAVVLSSATVPHPAGEPRFREAFAGVEEAAQVSGLGWTLLQSADFDANSLVWASSIRESGVVRGAYGQVATSAIDERDVAAVAAVAALDTAYAQRALVLTGPRAITQQEKLEAIGAAIGRTLSWQEMPAAVVRERLRQLGVPAEVPARLLGYLAARAADPGPTTGEVAQALGRPPRSFQEWARDHAGAFAREAGA